MLKPTSLTLDYKSDWEESWKYLDRKEWDVKVEK